MPNLTSPCRDALTHDGYAVKNRLTLRRFIAVAWFAILLHGLPALAESGAAVELDIPSQALDAALRQAAEKLRLQIIFASQDVAQFKTAGLKGRFSVLEAVTRLIEGTPLVYAFNGQDTIVIKNRSSLGGVGSLLASPTIDPATGSGLNPGTYDAKLAPGSESHGAPEITAIEEVVVTAQRREQKLQNVPVAVSAFTARQIEARGISTLLDLGSLAPNLQVSRAPNYSASSQVAIRGAVTTNNAMYLETTVGMYIDGVYMGKSMGSLMDNLDVERIEVLRGPQGTLYGRNTLAGAISFVSRKPLGESAGTATLDLGNYGAVAKKLSLDLPKMGIASISLGLRADDRSAIYPTVAGSATGGMENRNDEAARIAVNLDITRDFLAEFKFDSSRFNRLSGYHTLSNTQLDAYRPNVLSARNGPVALNSASYDNVRAQGLSMTLTWSLDERNTIKSITAHRSLDTRGANDLDATASSLVMSALSRNDYAQDSQEFQWAGNSGRLSYVGGFYYFRDRGDYSNALVYLDRPVPQAFGFTTRSTSWYGQLDYRATELLTLTAGLRSSNDDKTVERQFATGPARGQGSFSANTPLLSAAYKLSSRVNLYAKFAEGFKSGGFNAEASTADGLKASFNPEKVRSLELGAKTSSADGRAQLNAALFHNKARDMQLSVFLANGVSQIQNAGQASLHGLELEGIWLPADDLRLQASYAYLGGKYDRFADAGVDQAANRALPHAPRNSLNLLADVILGKTPWGTLRGIADYTHTGSFYTYAYQLAASGSLPRYDANRQVADNSQVDAAGFLNLRLVLSAIPVIGEGKAEAVLWIRNVTNREHIGNYIDYGPGTGQTRVVNWDLPRTYGVSFSYRW